MTIHLPEHRNNHRRALYLINRWVNGIGDRRGEGGPKVNFTRWFKICLNWMPDGHLSPGYTMINCCYKFRLIFSIHRPTSGKGMTWAWQTGGQFNMYARHPTKSTLNTSVTTTKPVKVPLSFKEILQAERTPKLNINPEWIEERKM